MSREKRLEFGWFLPTAGDTTAYGLASAQVAPSMPLFDKIVDAAEAAGFEYMLVPVQTACWEAWIASAMMVARSKSMRMLVAARPSYINPVLLAKMITTFDQLSGGRICINLIAGQSETENAAEGIKWGKEERYEIMDEEVSILKALWTTRGPLTHHGKFHTIDGAHIRPRPLQQPFPKFYLGGGSRHDHSCRDRLAFHTGRLGAPRSHFPPEVTSRRGASARRADGRVG